MRDIKNSEVTPERADTIKKLLIKLYEDQYQCKLVPVGKEEINDRTKKDNDQ